MLNMFRTLIHPSSGAWDFSIISPHWLCVLVSMCVGVSVWLGWSGIRVAGWSFSFTSSILNMFRTLIHPSSRAWDFSIISPHWLCVLVSMRVGVSVWLVGVVSVLQAEASHTDTTPTQPHRNSNTHRYKNTQPICWYNRKFAGFLMMDVLMSETCWV